VADPPRATVGILLPDPFGVSDTELARRLGALLGHARRSGVSLVHVGDGPGAARTERALLGLLPPPGPWALIVARTMPGAPAAPPQIEGATERWLRTSVELVPSPSPDGRLPPVPLRPADLVAPTGSAPWGVAVPGPGSLEPIRDRLRQLRPSWVRIPFHLLNAPQIAPLVDSLANDGIGVVADDPFAGGLLDGGWLSGSPLEAPGPPRDLDWETTRARLAPVAALGYLTEGRRRTLPDAALSYVRDRPGIAGVLVRVRTADDFAKLAPKGPALDDSERQRIEH
jgi:Aldo/keto reductase family